MFWESTVPISEQMYQTAGPIMRISRYLGCFPITVHKNKSTLFLKWSQLHALYSFLFGITAITLTFDGFRADVLIGNEKSIRIKSPSTMYVAFFDLFVVVLAAFCGIFVTPFKFATFCKYIHCFNQIDSKIPPVNTKYSRYLPALVTFSVLFLTLILQILDTLMHIRTHGDISDINFIIATYTPFYVCYHILMLSACLFWHLVYCILKRIKLLNKCLELENFINPQMKKMNMFVAPVNIVNTKSNRQVVGTVKYDTKVDDGRSIYGLILVYERLCDAVDVLNNLLGINCAVLIMGSLFNLITTYYGLIGALLTPRFDPLYIFLMVVWSVIHMGRLLLIAEPCYACLLEVQQTKDLVCRLIASAEINHYYKAQLRDFAIILQLRKFEFTAFGLASVDRMLITSILGAITTYLVILIQFTESAH